MITKQELKDLKSDFLFDFDRLVHIQCTKLPDVVTRTAELLDGVNETLCANMLRGQCMSSVSLLFILLLCGVFVYNVCAVHCDTP